MEYVKKFEKLIVVSLIAMMALVVLLATIDLGWAIARDVMSPPVFLLDIDELLGLFGLFLLVLIGLELLETINAYLVENVIHVEIVLEVALISIARKVIILDLEKYSGLTLLGVAALILSVAVAFFVVSRRFAQRPVAKGGD